MQFKTTLFFITLLIFTASCYYDNKNDLYDYVIVEGNQVPCEITAVSYNQDIVPILDLQCNGACHNANDRLGNIVLDSYNATLPYVNDGSLIGSIKHTNGFEVMPPSGQKIPICEIDKIQFWIDNGAPNN